MIFEKPSIAAPAVALGLFLSWGCGPSVPDRADDAPIPIEDVGEGLQIDPRDDRREVAPPQQLAGVLPGDFPRELPLHLPASIVELGSRSVTFSSQGTEAAVRSALRDRLLAQGWELEEAAREIVARRGNLEARLTLEDSRPGTRYTWVWTSAGR